MVLEFGVLPTGGGASGKQPDGGGCIYWLAASGQLCCQQTMLTWTPKEKHGLLMMILAPATAVWAQGTVVGRPLPREEAPALASWPPLLPFLLQ